tara:strand:- start:2520 stop:2681 length:162 start_codon:yes stop_codon:yes gene_type:complete
MEWTSDEKDTFMLNYIFNIKSSKKGAELVTEAHEAWQQYRFFCDVESVIGKAH